MEYIQYRYSLIIVMRNKASSFVWAVQEMFREQKFTSSLYDVKFTVFNTLPEICLI